MRLAIDFCSILDVPEPEKSVFRFDGSTIFRNSQFWHPMAKNIEKTAGEDLPGGWGSLLGRPGGAGNPLGALPGGLGNALEDPSGKTLEKPWKNLLKDLPESTCTREVA